MARDSSDESSSGDSEDEVLAARCELRFSASVALGPRLNVEDLSYLECEQLFRYHSEK